MNRYPGYLPLLAALALFAAGASARADEASVSESSSSQAPAVRIPDEAALRQAVTSYVRNTRAWTDGSYEIAFDRRDGDLLIFDINYTRGDSPYNLVTNVGQSFAVEIDPATRKVVREIFF